MVLVNETTLFHKVYDLDDFNKKSTCNFEFLQDKNVTIMNEEWKFNIFIKPKLRIYLTLKENTGTENDVKYHLSCQQRCLMLQLTLCILLLHIETGRCNGKKLDNRLCRLGDAQEIEDEIHFICKCNLYEHNRVSMFRNVRERCDDFELYANMEQFVFITLQEWKILSINLFKHHQKKNRYCIIDYINLNVKCTTCSKI